MVLALGVDTRPSKSIRRTRSCSPASFRAFVEIFIRRLPTVFAARSAGATRGWTCFDFASRRGASWIPEIPTPAISAMILVSSLSPWFAMESARPGECRRQRDLLQLNKLANAIAHRDFGDLVPLNNRTTVRLGDARRWRTVLRATGRKLMSRGWRPSAGVCRYRMHKYERTKINVTTRRAPLSRGRKDRIQIRRAKANCTDHRRSRQHRSWWRPTATGRLRRARGRGRGGVRSPGGRGYCRMPHATQSTPDQAKAA